MSRTGERPGKAGSAAELAARWTYLKRRFGPVLPPEALALVLILAASLVLSALVQFGTPLFDDHPGISIAVAGANVLLAIAAAVLVIARGRYEREQLTLLVVLGLVVVLSMGSMGAKMQYQRGLAGNPFYALPHQRVPYPPEAREMYLRTTDGVRLVGTLLSGGNPRAVLIYPSWRTGRRAFSVSTMALWLSNGFDVLVLEPRGQGDSGGAKTPDGAAKYDVAAGAAYLAETGHRQVGVLGEQDAAYPILLAAGMGRGIDSVALAAPSDEWGGSLGQGGRLWDPHGLWGRLYWRVAAGLRLAGSPEGPPITAVVAGAAPTPILFLTHRSGAGTEADRLHGAAGEPKSLIILPGTADPVGWPQFAEYYKAVEQWFELSLRTDEEPGESPTATP